MTIWLWQKVYWGTRLPTTMNVANKVCRHILLMNECGNGESEYGNVDAERDAIFIDHFVVTLHGAQRGFNNCTAGVLVLFCVSITPS